MKPRTKFHCLLALLVAPIYLALVVAGLAGDTMPGQIHDYPDEYASSGQNQHQLSFEYPNDQLARAEFKSEAFYAIILKSAARCSLTNEERIETQKMFPNNKVFMDLFGCDDYLEENITYTNINPDYTFIAVFGGKSIEQAKQLFDQHGLAEKFPGANIRKMQAVLVYS